MEGSHTSFSLLDFFRTRSSVSIETVCTGETTLDYLVHEIARFRPSIVRMLDLVLQLALEAGASDIHLDPKTEIIVVRLRVDGFLYDVHTIPITHHHEIIARIKILASLRIDEHGTPQDGRFQSEIQNTVIDIRISIVPTHHGENAVLRILKKEDAQLSLDMLGFSTVHSSKIVKAIKKPYGMILVTGPTGSGKTTTLYSMVSLLNKPETSIITIEDPIEYAIEGVNQIQVSPGVGMTFATSLRSVLRQDPNVIMIGEIRDHETAAMATNTALTGHIVLSTLHTNDAPSTLLRLIDMKIEPYLIASTVTLVIAQRLVRKLCNKCQGIRCRVCKDTGYKGRIGIHEVLEIDEHIRKMITEGNSVDTIAAYARHSGMCLMYEDGLEKVSRGITTHEEIERIHYA